MGRPVSRTCATRTPIIRIWPPNQLHAYIERTLYASIASVNSLPVLSNALLDVGLEPLDDRLYSGNDGGLNLQEFRARNRCRGVG